MLWFSSHLIFYGIVLFLFLNRKGFVGRGLFWPMPGHILVLFTFGSASSLFGTTFAGDINKIALIR